jgi:serine protease
MRKEFSLRREKGVASGVYGVFLILFLSISVIPTFPSTANATKPPIFEKHEFNTAVGGYVPGQIVVKFKPEVSEKVINELNSRHGCSKLYKDPFVDFYVLRILGEETVSGMLKKYSEEPIVEYAQASYICSAFFVPNDPLYSFQWHFPMIHMEQAWDVQLGGDPSIVVAVLDTGVAYENYSTYLKARDLAGTSFVQGYDFISNDPHPNDDNAHGTHVTGTIAQTTNNGYGVAGVAFKTSIMPVKVLDSSGSGTDVTLADGIRYAADNGAHVISMSLGFDPSVTPGDIPVVTEAVEYAYSKGVILVASSGNDGVGVVSLPAAYPEVIAVGAVHSGDARASYSQYGSALEVVAPGGDDVDRNSDGYMDGVLQETFNPNTKNPSDFGFWFFYGTSQAAPHVSGLVALLLAQDPTRTCDEIRNILHTTSIDLGAPGWDEEYGYGRIDASAALLIAEGYDYVDNSVSDVDASADKGTHSNFPAQQYGPDSIYDTLTEKNTGAVEFDAITLDKSASSRSSGSFSHTVGSGDNRLLIAVFMLVGSRTVSSCSYAGDALTHAKTQDSGSLSGCEIQIWYLVNPPTGSNTFSFTYGQANNPDAVAVISYARVNQSSPIGANGGAHANSGTDVSCTITTTVANSLIVGGATGHGGDTYPYTPGSGITEHWDDRTGTSTRYDAGLWGGEMPASTTQQYTFGATQSVSDGWAIACVEVKPALEANYELDLEVQWTNATYDMPNEELCIFGGTMGSEDIRVDVWNGSTWHNLFTDLSSGWNNVSVTDHLVSSMFTIRFKGGAETGDTSQDSWQIDCTLLHTWTPVGFDLNLRIRDWDLTDNIQGAYVYVDSAVKASDADGWANWTGVSGIVQIKVKWYGFWVNGTFSVTVGADTTVNIQCKLCDVTITVQEGVQSAYLVSVNVTAFNATSTSANKIKSGITGSKGQVILTNLPNYTLTFTQYGGSSYTLVIGNTTQLISSENQSFSVTSDQNYVSTSNPFSIIALVGMVIPLKRRSLTKRLKRKSRNVEWR